MGNEKTETDTLKTDIEEMKKKLDDLQKDVIDLRKDLKQVIETVQTQIELSLELAKNAQSGRDFLFPGIDSKSINRKMMEQDSQLGKTPDKKTAKSTSDKRILSNTRFEKSLTEQATALDKLKSKYP